MSHRIVGGKVTVANRAQQFVVALVHTYPQPYGVPIVRNVADPARGVEK